MKKVGEAGGSISVHHPRFLLIPGLSAGSTRRSSPEQCCHWRGGFMPKTPFDLIDAQFFYPDGPAAARVAQALGLPHAIKARGSDIHLWGGKPAALAQMRRAAGCAAAVLAVSSALAGDMAALGLAPPGGINRALYRPRSCALSASPPRRGPVSTSPIWPALPPCARVTGSQSASAPC